MSLLEDFRRRRRRNRAGASVQLKGFEVFLQTMEALMKRVNLLLDWFFGDPKWKTREKIDWSRVAFIRRRLTSVEKENLIRASEKEVDDEFGDRDKNKDRPPWPEGGRPLGP